MKVKKEYWILGAIAALLILPKLGRASYWTITDWLIPEFESFSAHPYWDVNRYSWGYGTRAPGSSGTITREQALQEMRAYIQADFNYLYPMLTRELSAHQWAALLSFSYNLGKGAADNLIPNINAGNWQALGDQWNSYINSGGSANPTLVDRRALEWKIFNGEV